MKRIKAINGYTIYQATARDEQNYNVEAGYFYLYFSSDIRDYGIAYCDPDYEAGSLEEAISFATGTNYAIAKEYAEESTTAATYDEIAEIEKQLDAGATLEEIDAAQNEDVEKEDKIMINNHKVSISKGNSKMGHIPSVSLPPIRTCAYGCKCASKCYAAKLCRIYPSVRNAYDRNLEILLNDDISYWYQVNQAVKMSPYFRFHVSGDIIDSHYFNCMVSVAEQNPNTTILAFTKQYEIVNNYLDIFGRLPENLKIIFSEWPGMPMENPHNLPVAHVIFKGSQPDDDWKICGGNCSECACRGVGCWELKTGEHIAFYEH